MADDWILFGDVEPFEKLMDSCSDFKNAPTLVKAKSAYGRLPDYEYNGCRRLRTVFNRYGLNLDHQVGMRQTAHFDSRARR